MATTRRESVNRLSPWKFVLAFGAVSMLADFVYEGSRAITGPYLATLGASAAMVGFITGAGEAVAFVFRLVTGPLSDRTRKYWALSILGYGMTVVSVPFLALTANLPQAGALIIAERFGKAVRTPARDTMLAQAGSKGRRGVIFAVHEALDQSGALLGPLLVALMVALSGYRLGFAVLAVPAALALLALAWLRWAVPNPAAYEVNDPTRASLGGPRPIWSGFRFSSRFWQYTGFTALSMLGFATFGVLSYHLQVRHVVAPALIPVIYAAAMGIAALTALGSGRLYDRVGLRGLVIALPLGASVPFLSFSTEPALVWLGSLVWGAAMGIHESTMRAAVADLVPSEQRGAAYGIFAAAYGVAWLAGATLIGILYTTSMTALDAFVVISQVLAFVAFLPLWGLVRRDIS